jgi:hypothetical protein
MAHSWSGSSTMKTEGLSRSTVPEVGGAGTRWGGSKALRTLGTDPTSRRAGALEGHFDRTTHRPDDLLASRTARVGDAFARRERSAGRFLRHRGRRLGDELFGAACLPHRRLRCRQDLGGPGSASGPSGAARRSAGLALGHTADTGALRWGRIFWETSGEPRRT